MRTDPTTVPSLRMRAEGNYYRQEKREPGAEEKVPIKWMALESIEIHVFDESTDVVSNYYLQ